jgi:DNA-binding NtrC family response regulator
MQHNCGVFRDGLIRERSFSPVLIETNSRFSTGREKLKKASDSLRRLFRRRENVYPEEPRHHQLLVVDDEQSIVFSMSDFFTQKGFKVDTAYEVEEAENLIETNEYEAMILDLRLGASPYPLGLDVIKFAHQRTPNTRIVVLTACSSMEIEKEALSTGADVFLRKPKPLSQLAQVVQVLVESPRKRAASHKS